MRVKSFFEAAHNINGLWAKLLLKGFLLAQANTMFTLL